MNSIVIDGKEIRVSIQPSERARKTVDIEFRSKEELIVTLPKGQDVDIEVLLRKNEALINRKYRTFLNRIHILDDNKILYKGNRYKIQLLRTNSPKEESITINDDELNIRLRENENSLKALKGWISQKTQILIDSVVEEYSTSLDGPKRVFITDTKRWGYTRKNGEVVYNWQLSALPPELGEYVVVHELVHLVHMNHKRSFHSKMVMLIPDYKRKEEMLHNYVAIDLTFENKRFTD